MIEKGYIYVLTNKSFNRENWVKIGYTENIDRRIKELSNTSLPYPYQLYCKYEIPRIQGLKDPDRLLHDLITMINPELRIAPNREFFEMHPIEAYNMLDCLAKIHGKSNNLVKVKQSNFNKYVVKNERHLRKKRGEECFNIKKQTHKNNAKAMKQGSIGKKNDKEYKISKNYLRMRDTEFCVAIAEYETYGYFIDNFIMEDGNKLFAGEKSALKFLSKIVSICIEYGRLDNGTYILDSNILKTEEKIRQIGKYEKTSVFKLYKVDKKKGNGPVYCIIAGIECSLINDDIFEISFSQKCIDIFQNILRMRHYVQ